MNIISKQKTFTKYVISYSIVLLIPVILLGIVMYYSIAQLLREQSIKISNEILISARDNIDNRISELNMAALQIHENENLKKHKLARRDISFVNAVDTLNKIIFPSEFFTECFIYFFDNDLIYSPSGTYRTSQFIENIYVYEKWTSNDFFNEVRNINKPLIRQAENIYPSGDRKRGESFFTYIVPIQDSAGKAEGVVIFTIKHEVFNKILSDIEDVYNGNVLILDDIHNLVTGEYDLFINLKETLDINERNYVEKIKIDDKYYILSTVNSTITGWRYISLIPSEAITYILQPMVVKIILGFISVIIIGIAVIILFSKMNYKPIKRLLAFSLGLHREANEGDEMDRVVKIFEYMGRRIDSLQNRMDASKPMLKKSLLIELIKGYYSEIDEFNKIAEEIGVKLYHSQFNVVIFHLSKVVKTEYIKIITDIEEKFFSKTKAYGFDGVDEKQFTFIVVSNDSNTERLRETLGQIELYLNSNYNIKVSAYVGDWCVDVASIGNSYLQAVTLANNRSIKEKDGILFYKDLDEYDKYVGYNFQEKFEILELCILQGEKNKIKELLYEMFNEIQEQETPLFLVKSICYNMINYVLAIGKRNVKELNFRKYKYSDIITLVRFDTVDELSEQILEICMYITNLVQEIKEKNSSNRIQQMIDYLNQYYTDCNFSLQSMSEYFNMSISNLSNYFKSSMNENISDYVNKLRIAKAKELLKHTETSVQDIVYIIGYLNVSSFIRKFKLETGVTPGSFRELSKRN